MIYLSKKSECEGGFSLIECMVALVVANVGLLAVAGLIAVGVRLQTDSRDASAASAFARSKIEEIENYSPAALQRVRGGDLATDVTNYSDVPDNRFKRRWLIEVSPTDAGVPLGTQRITVLVIPNRPDLRLPPVRLVVLIPAT